MQILKHFLIDFLLSNEFKRFLKITLDAVNAYLRNGNI